MNNCFKDVDLSYNAKLIKQKKLNALQYNLLQSQKRLTYILLVSVLQTTNKNDITLPLVNAC